jgi:hypothetical protein
LQKFLIEENFRLVLPEERKSEKLNRIITAMHQSPVAFDFGKKKLILSSTIHQEILKKTLLFKKKF